jgi:hypothetical protein
MNKYQKWLIVSIVFLVATLVVPIYVLYNALTSNLAQYVQNLPTLQDQPHMNEFFRSISAEQQMLLLMVTVVEAALVAAFAMTLWYAIKCRDQCRNYPAAIGKTQSK